MTRDSAAVAALDDRRRSRCPVPAASDVSPDDAAPSSSMMNGVDAAAAGGSSSSNGVDAAAAGGSSSSNGGGDRGSSSPKSSSAASTSTGGGGSSSRSGSDDDDSGAAVVRPSDALPQPRMDAVAGDQESSGCCNSDEAPTADPSSSIRGRLTFYKDGQFIFQLAAHHQQQSFKNQSATTTACRWVPVPTVVQQHKNNVKSIGEWPQHQQNKTIWPYLITSPTHESKSPQPTPQPQLPVAKAGDRKQQPYQHGKTPPPPTVSNAVNMTSCTTAVVMATTTNIVRRPSRKCLTTTAAAPAENSADGPSQNWQPESQSRPLSKHSQPYQHQSFVMVATRAAKAQRRAMSLASKQRRRCRRKTAAGGIKGPPADQQQPPSVSLECVVRNLWCRRHTTELLIRRRMSMSGGGGTDVVDGPPAARHATGPADAPCPITAAGNGKRRSAFSAVPAADLAVTTAADSMGATSGTSSPSKKYRLGQQQQQRPSAAATTDKGAKKTVGATAAAANNDHSITAILSGGAAGARRATGDPDNCVISSTTCATAAAVTPLTIPPLPSPAPLSLLRTLLKSPGGEIGCPSPVAAGANGVGYKHHQSGRKRSAAAESAVAVPQPLPPATAVDNGARSTTVMASPAAAVGVGDAAAAALTALHQLPGLHHPSTVAAAGQLAAAGYFNVLYHQAAMAAAMVYQTHAQLPKSQPLLQTPQFPPVAGNSWNRQSNRRQPPPPPVLPPTAAKAAASSASTVVAPYSSPLASVAVNGGLLPPATPSPPPPPHLPLRLQPVGQHRRHPFLHQQPYQPAPAVQQKLPPSSYHPHSKRRPPGSGVKQRIAVAGSAEYGDRADGNGAGHVSVESSPSADCMPLNLSKDSVAENVGDTSTTATVR